MRHRLAKEVIAINLEGDYPCPQPHTLPACLCQVVETGQLAAIAECIEDEHIAMVCKDTMCDEDGLEKRRTGSHTDGSATRCWVTKKARK